jgi:hypothetical protein
MTSLAQACNHNVKTTGLAQTQVECVVISGQTAWLRRGSDVWVQQPCLFRHTVEVPMCACFPVCAGPSTPSRDESVGGLV